MMPQEYISKAKQKQIAERLQQFRLCGVISEENNTDVVK